MPAPGRHETGQATPYLQQVYLPQHSTGAQMATTKANTAPSTSQGCNEMAQGDEGAEVGPHPKGLEARPGEIDPPPEDLGSITEASTVTILWTMSPTMWPWVGKETSPTS